MGSDTKEIATKLLIISAILVGTWVARWFIVSVIAPRLARVLQKRTKTTLDERMLEAIEPPLRFLIGIVGIWAALAVLKMSGPLRIVAYHIMSSLIAVAIFWALYRSVDVVADAVRALTRRKPGGPLTTALDKKLLDAVQQLTRMLIILITFSVIMEEWGYSIAGLMAGLGLGGLAVALAAQDALANLIGYFVILADEPFVLGEFVVIGDQSGTVERMGLRSARLRTSDQSLVAVPNKTIVNSNVVNWSRLTKRRLNMTFGLDYEASPASVLSVIQAIREMLQTHELVQSDSVIVQFADLTESALKLTIICFMKTPAWADFQAARQDINFRIMKIMQDRGVTPAQNTQLLVVQSAAAKPAAAPAGQKKLPPLEPEPKVSTAVDSPVPDDAAN
jgi:MscS family membrane protein